jgi:hypothetical protein
LSKREPGVVFNKSLKDRVENTIRIKRHLHSTLVWVRHLTHGSLGSQMPQKDENPRLIESWDASPKQPSPSAARFVAYRKLQRVGMAQTGDSIGCRVDACHTLKGFTGETLENGDFAQNPWSGAILNVNRSIVGKNVFLRWRVFLES